MLILKCFPQCSIILHVLQRTLIYFWEFLFQKQFNWAHASCYFKWCHFFDICFAIVWLVDSFEAKFNNKIWLTSIFRQCFYVIIFNKYFFYNSAVLSEVYLVFATIGEVLKAVLIFSFEKKYALYIIICALKQKLNIVAIEKILLHLNFVKASYIYWNYKLCCNYCNLFKNTSRKFFSKFNKTATLHGFSLGVSASAFIRMGKKLPFTYLSLTVIFWSVVSERLCF